MIARDDGKKPSLTPQTMLRDGRTYPDLPLRVVGLSSPNPGDTKLTVVALVEPLDRSVTLGSAAFGLIDERGRLVAQWTANARELGVLPVMSAGLASPGRYRMRVAAIDTTGRRGSADYELLAEAAPIDGLTMSTMVLGVSYERNFVPKLQFVSEPTANGSFEIFGSPSAGTLSVSMELATADDGPALVRVPGAIVATADTNRRRASGVVPIGQLAPGDYVLRAIVSLDGRPITTLVASCGRRRRRPIRHDAWPLLRISPGLGTTLTRTVSAIQELLTAEHAERAEQDPSGSASSAPSAVKGF